MMSLHPGVSTDPSSSTWLYRHLNECWEKCDRPYQLDKKPKHSKWTYLCKFYWMEYERAITYCTQCESSKKWAKTRSSPLQTCDHGSDMSYNITTGGAYSNYEPQVLNTIKNIHITGGGLYCWLTISVINPICDQQCCNSPIGSFGDTKLQVTSNNYKLLFFLSWLLKNL
jgi:hypothetical protein